MLIITILSALTICSACTSCTWIKKNYPHDNVVEEIAEDVLEHKTGIDVDFTPYSPEPSKKNK